MHEKIHGEKKTSYEGYLNRYFPKKAQEARWRSTKDPYTIGVELAEKSLDEFSLSLEEELGNATDLTPGIKR